MTENKKIGIITHKDFAIKNNPPYPRPIFLSYENSMRIERILRYLEQKKLYDTDEVIIIKPNNYDPNIIKLAHSKYYINTIKSLSAFGGGTLSEELFITEDTYDLAKKAVDATITALELVINKKLCQSFALIRPPGHHALKEMGSGLCIFNNIANAILYLRNHKQYDKKIAIIDIDDHLGDGLVQYFYEDPDVLYFSVHEYDFLEGGLGLINELGEDKGKGTNINFPVPSGLNNNEFLEIMDLLEPILTEFKPDIVIVAAGFDMYFDDPIGNCSLTSHSYYQFTKKLLTIANNVCKGRLIYILEGGYSLIGLPICIYSVISALLGKEYEQPFYEKLNRVNTIKQEEILKIKEKLKELLKKYWKL